LIYFLLGVEMEQTFMHHLQLKSMSLITMPMPGSLYWQMKITLKVILRNLVSNAIKFTDNKGNITLATQIKNNSIIISITDTGKGMDADEIEKTLLPQYHFSHSGTSGERANRHKLAFM